MTAELLVNVDVDDLPKAVEFYSAAFGLQPGRRFADQAIELVGASSRVYLLAKPAGSRACPTTNQPRDYRRHWTPVHLDFAVAEIDAAVQRAIVAGATLEGDVQTFAWGRLAPMADPFGNGFCLVQFLGRGYDEIAS